MTLLTNQPPSARRAASPERPSKLETFIAGLCREQPLLRSPDPLTRRILVEIERRAALPWWRRPFRSWPAATRAPFVVLCGVIGATLASALGRAHGAAPWRWLQDAVVSASFTNDLLNELGAVLVRSIPALWLYGGLLGLCGLYAVLAVLSVSAFRLLHAPRRMAQGLFHE